METVNGWANKETWNIALHINNDEFLYRSAVAFAEDAEADEISYQGFVQSLGLSEAKTTDGVAFVSDRLDYAQLDEMMLELAEGLD